MPNKYIDCEINQALKDALSDIGIDFDLIISEEKDVREYVDDSMAFISFIVDLENRFDFCFPDELLSHDNTISVELLKKAILSN